VAALVKIVDGGAVLYRQHRVGRDGRHFVMLKFRTMVGAPERDGEADSQWADYAAGHAGVGASALDDAARPDRTTPLGHVLRRLSLDELPQLWNVLTGEMSMIGPRPERVRYAQRFEDTIYRYRDRHRVRSGITGWAQVNGLRGQTSLRDRVEADNYYIENWSLWLDLKIVLKTIAVLLRDVFTADHMKPLRRSAEEPTPSDTLAHRAAGSAP
jgi:lipopolysaccharide/colanic/teichoic acid biosynthesis glycosyltransferase